MAKKYPSELNTKTIRINIGDYGLLSEISRKADVTMAEALHLLLERQEPETRLSPAQIPMPAFRATAPVAFRVRGEPAIVLNGVKPIIFVVKPKGGVVRD